MISTSNHAVEFEADKFELVKISYTNNGENVFSYRIAYDVDVANDGRSGRSTKRVTVHSTHSIEMFENGFDFELDLIANSMQSTTNGLTTISASATFENEQYDVQADIEHDQDIYTVTLVTKNWLESRSSAELNIKDQKLTAFISTPEQPDKARLTASVATEKLDAVAKFD